MARNRNRSVGNKGKKTGHTIAANFNDDLAKSFGSLNYSYLPGTLFNEDLTQDTVLSSSLPSLMRFRFVPTIGSSKGSTAPINLVSNKIYAKMRAANSGAKSCDPNNVIITLMAMDSIHMYYAWMIRLRSALDYYVRTDLNVPDTLLLGMNVDPVDLRDNTKQLEGYINLFAKRASRLVVPNVIPIILDHSRLIAGVYTDECDILSQMYMFQPAGFYHYIENADAGEKFGTLEFLWMEEQSGGFQWTFEDIVTFGNKLLEDVLNSEDIGLITGDLIKAFGDSDVITLETREQFPELQVMYDEDVLLAIHNADTLEVAYNSITDTEGEARSYVDSIVVGPITANGTDNNVSQNISYKTGSLQTGKSPHTALWLDKKIIDQKKSNPEIADNYNAIRFKCAFDRSKNPTNSGDIEFKCYGSELLLAPTVYVRAKQSGINSAPVTIGVDMPTVVPVSDVTESTLLALRNQNMVSTFAHAPFVYYGTLTASNSQLMSVMSQDVIYIGNIVNPTLIDDSTLQNMFTAFFMAEFGV